MKYELDAQKQSTRIRYMIHDEWNQNHKTIVMT